MKTISNNKNTLKKTLKGKKGQIFAIISLIILILAIFGAYFLIQRFNLDLSWINETFETIKRSYWNGS